MTRRRREGGSLEWLCLRPTGDIFRINALTPPSSEAVEGGRTASSRMEGEEGSTSEGLGSGERPTPQGLEDEVFLKNILPEDFTYDNLEISHLKYDEEHLMNTEFNAVLNININSISQVDLWVNEVLKKLKKVTESDDNY